MSLLSLFDFKINANKYNMKAAEIHHPQHILFESPKYPLWLIFLALLIVNILFIIVLVLYLSKRWNEAQQKRDTHDSQRVGASGNVNEKKSSIFPFLFK